MKTFSIGIVIEGKVTVPDTVLRELRIAASNEPGEQGGDRRLHQLNIEHPTDDDAFLRGALEGGLRNIARNGIIADISAMGVGCKAAPPRVTVSVPERVVTAVKAREQIAVDRLTVENKAEGEFNPLAVIDTVTGT